MFGGKDFVYKNISGPAARVVALTFLRSAWPAGLVVDPEADSEAPVPIAEAERLRGKELLVFESRAAEAAWEEFGLPKGMEDTMVILFTGPRQATVVAATEAVAAPGCDGVVGGAG